MNIDKADNDSNYYMGLIYLLGLGVDSNIPKAHDHFQKAQNDSRALNGLGYIYFKAPEYLEKDPKKLYEFG